jgi:hypothetical protein
VANAAKHNTGKMGQQTAKAEPIQAKKTPKRTGFLRPWRSVYRPAGMAMNTWVSEKSANKTPTAKVL